MVDTGLHLTFEGIAITIRRSEVLRHLGYRGGRAGAQVQEELTAAIHDACSLTTPGTVSSLERVRELRGGNILLDSGLSLQVGGAAGEWQGLDYVGLAVCTIGPALERRVAELFARDDPLAALVLDCAGSVAVEALADEVNYRICCAQRAAGNRVGPRASPGYGRWPLSDQAVLLSILPAETIGVGLNQSFMMTPRKSCSFCAGIGRRLPETFNPCRRCGRENCEHRQSPGNLAGDGPCNGAD